MGANENDLFNPIDNDSTPDKKKEDDARYQEVLKYFQLGQWDAAQPVLEALLQEYPNDTQLRELMQQLLLKKEIAKTEKKHWLRLPHIPGNLVRGVILALLLVGFALIGSQFYKQNIVPHQQEAHQQALVLDELKRAEEAMNAGQYKEASQFYQDVLAKSPDQPMAKAGLKAVDQYLILDDQYQKAVAWEKQGKIEKAIAAYQEIVAQDSNYKDVNQRLQQLLSTIKIEQAWNAGEKAYQQKQWTRAISYYETVSGIDDTYHHDLLQQHLYESFLNQGKEMLQNRPANVKIPIEAYNYLRRALQVKPRDPEATSWRDFARNYNRGYTEFLHQQWQRAAAYWVPIYQKEPQFLGGLLAEQLFACYYNLAEGSALAGDLQQAYQLYRIASTFPIAEADKAKQKADAIGLQLTPTPTPTVTPTPTPTPLPTPTLAPLNRYNGWIAFYSDRAGMGAIYMMKPDGSHVIMNNNPDVYNKLRDAEAYSPDHKRRVYVEGSGRSTNVYIWRTDVPANWEHRILLWNNGSINYDPVWSPLGDLIALVSETAGSDDIWVLHADGSGKPKQLTPGTWEWDKHPSWSPNGRQIVFWSNRVTGRKQIWIMNADGSHLHNISNDAYNDWDPIWIKR